MMSLSTEPELGFVNLYTRNFLISSRCASQSLQTRSFWKSSCCLYSCSPAICIISSLSRAISDHRLAGRYSLWKSLSLHCLASLQRLSGLHCFASAHQGGFTLTPLGVSEFCLWADHGQNGMLISSAWRGREPCHGSRVPQHPQARAGSQGRVGSSRALPLLGLCSLWLLPNAQVLTGN